MTIMCIAIALVCAGLVLLLPMPARASWGYAILSALLHVGYNLFLVRTYRAATLGRPTRLRGDPRPCWCPSGRQFSQMSCPMRSPWQAFCWSPAASSRLPFRGAARTNNLLYALGTGCFIGAYSVADGIGVRSRARLSAIRSGCACCGASWCCRLCPRPRLAQPHPRPPRNVGGGGGGIVSLVAYGAHHLCHVARPDGAGVGSPRDQRGVRSADRPFLSARTADRLPDRSLPCRRDRRGLHRA